MLTNDYIVGTCKEMCPASEISMRKKNHLVHFYEKKVFVKEFSRSAADKKQQQPADLRTFSALEKTLDYLINTILFDQARPFNFRYDFIFDRCRAVRQEIVIQNFSCEKTVKLLEPIAMFLTFSMYRLNGSPISIFDTKICSQHLQECLLKCLTCYEELERLNQHEHSKSNRNIIEGIYLLLNLDDSVALQRAIKLGMKSSYIMRLSIRISLNYQLNNFYKFLRDIRLLPHLLCAVVSLKLPQVRKEILSIFSIAYNSSTLKVPVDFIQRLLIYDCDETEMLARDLNELGICATGEKPPTVKFERKKFDRSKSISNTSHQIVETKLRDFHLPDLILLKTV